MIIIKSTIRSKQLGVKLTLSQSVKMFLVPLLPCKVNLENFELLARCNSEWAQFISHNSLQRWVYFLFFWLRLNKVTQNCFIGYSFSLLASIPRVSHVHNMWITCVWLSLFSWAAEKSHMLKNVEVLARCIMNILPFFFVIDGPDCEV